MLNYKSVIREIKKLKKQMKLKSTVKVFYLKRVNKKLYIEDEYLHLITKNTIFNESVKDQIKHIEKTKGFIGFIAPLFIYMILMLDAWENSETIQIEYTNDECLNHFKKIPSLTEIWDIEKR